MVNVEFQLGLIGFPLEHSLSPAIHDAALKALGLEGEYRLYPVSPMPEGSSTLVDLLEMLRRGKLQGLNVTIPHKQFIPPYLDALTPTAQAIGAVNTIFYKEELLWGDNTDAAGFMADLEILGWTAQDVEDPHALILGSGGSARAVSYALAHAGWRLTIAARRLEQAQELTKSILHFSSSTPMQDGSDLAIPILLESSALSALESSPNLIVNTTPLGMKSRQDESPWPERTVLPPQAALYDLVYNPPETKLIKIARKAGLYTANGLGMLVEQAALSFEIWTGQKALRDAMRAAVQVNTIGAT
jgi:shikimate dehydrogenase